ncbi:MAG: hypothetical protein SF052_24415 [Bacteroidia bacterium]|nr:hypothetical protein [Bacteroidia bacterium]
MLGLLLIYFIGKNFYELADDYEKSKWGFAILGVVSYYLGTFLGGIILSIILEISGTNSLDDINSMLVSLIALPFGLLSCIGLYFILKRNWEKNREATESIIDNIGKGDHSDDN